MLFERSIYSRQADIQVQLKYIARRFEPQIGIETHNLLKWLFLEIENNQKLLHRPLPQYLTLNCILPTKNFFINFLRISHSRSQIVKIPRSPAAGHGNQFFKQRKIIQNVCKRQIQDGEQCRYFAGLNLFCISTPWPVIATRLSSGTFQNHYLPVMVAFSGNGFGQYHCNYCQADCTTLRVKCAECQDFDLCVLVRKPPPKKMTNPRTLQPHLFLTYFIINLFQCFSSGAEMGSHKRDHDYQLIVSVEQEIKVAQFFLNIDVLFILLIRTFLYVNLLTHDIVLLTASFSC